MGDFEALVLPRSDTPVRLVFVHGIHQGDKTSLTLQETWEDALLSAWAAAGLEKQDYTLEMPYYAALLAELICRARSEAGFFTHLEETLLRDIGIEKGISEHHVRAEFDREIPRSRLATGNGCKASHAFSNAMFRTSAILRCASFGRSMPI